MPTVGKIFISHAHEDNALCHDLIRMLEQWGAPYWIDFEDQSYSRQLAEIIDQAMADCDTFLRLSTSAALSSEWMQREREQFLSLLQSSRGRYPFISAMMRKKRQPQRHYINIVLDGYQPDSADMRFRFIDGRGQPQAMWLDSVRKAVGKPMGCWVFNRDDRDYLWWIHNYQAGWVLNIDRRMTLRDYRLHHAKCPAIGEGFAEGALAARGTFKVCALTPSELQTWARVSVGGDVVLSPCGQCMYNEANPLA